jgi:opacity protein-like surface antigen
MLKRFTAIALLIIFSTSVFAQYDNPGKKRSKAGSRDGRFEASVILAFQTGLDASYDGGSELSIDSTAGWGVSFAWNWTDKWNVSYRLISTSPNYTALVVPEDPNILPQVIEHKLSKFSHQVNMTYNFSRKAFTPFVSGGIGYGKLDSNVPSAPPQTGCWWDPWWGYICVSDWRTYTSSGFTYSIGAGVRWDINNAIYTKASYVREFMNVDNGSINFDTAIFELGMMF